MKTRKMFDLGIHETRENPFADPVRLQKHVVHVPKADPVSAANDERGGPFIHFPSALRCDSHCTTAALRQLRALAIPI